MRWFNYLLFLSLFLGISSKAQIVFDSIPRCQAVLNDKITFNTNEDVLNQLCSKSDSIIKRIDECDDNQPYYLKYCGLDVFEIKGYTIRKFIIRSSKFRLKFKNLAVGDPASILEKTFPTAYRNKTKINPSEYLVSVFVGLSDQKMIFTIKDGIITEFKSFYPC